MQDRERVLQEKIEKFQSRLEVRARSENFDLTKVNYTKMDNPDPVSNRAKLVAFLYTDHPVFSHRRVVHIGAPVHLAKLSDTELSLYIRRALERHDNAEGKEKDSVRYQAFQLHAIRSAYAELLKRN